MTQEEFDNLDRGDVVCHVGSTQSFVVDANYGNHVIAVRAVDLTNPPEWELRAKARLEFKAAGASGGD